MIPRALNNVAFYRDAEGYLIPLIAGSFQHVAVVSEFVIGIIMRNRIYAIYDNRERQILVILDDLESILMSEELHERFDQFFVRLSPPTPPRLNPDTPNQRRRDHPYIINRH